ncbi:MAG: alpha/beta hydrolase [Pseudomonadota bacterium]
MRIEVNGVRLFFDIEGPKLAVEDNALVERPTLILLHGGPGMDHALFKPQNSALADIAQIVYLDHRANGRSDSGPQDRWCLEQWADDIAAFCDALEIDKPVIQGVSFGGFVAQAFATRYPERLGGLVLVSTAARMDFEQVYDAFERRGGPDARRTAKAYWGSPSIETRNACIAHCLPLYTYRAADPSWMKRVIRRDDVALHFNGPANEQGRMDHVDGLARITCPTLVMAGEDDPITPMVFSEEIVAGLTNAPVQFERYAKCGHGVFGDVPEEAMVSLRQFLLDRQSNEEGD